MPEHVNRPAQDAAAVDEFVRRARDVLGANLLALKLFGSKARGEGEEDSDIDVLVVVAESGSPAEDRVLDVAFEVNLSHGVYISPRVIAGATLEDPVWRITPFLQVTEREGVPL